jgi:outer membrane protein
VGEVTRTDVALTEARLAGARSLLAQAQGDYSIAIEAYQAYVGRAPGKLAPPPAMKLPVASVDAAKAQAMKLHPTLKQAQHQVSAADIGVEIAKRATMPRVTLNGTLGSSSRANSPYWQDAGTVGLSASGVIYQGGQLRALTRKAMAQRDAARGALHDARSEIGQNVGGAFARVKVAQAALAATDEQIRAARVAFQGVREEAALGSRTTLDVLNAEQELLDAQANLISAASNEYVAYYSLLASMGLLTVDQLNLKVTRYDPAEYYNLVHKAPSALSKQGKKLDKVLQRLGKE